MSLDLLKGLVCAGAEMISFLWSGSLEAFPFTTHEALLCVMNFTDVAPDDAHLLAYGFWCAYPAVVGIFLLIILFLLGKCVHPLQEYIGINSEASADMVIKVIVSFGVSPETARDAYHELDAEEIKEMLENPKAFAKDIGNFVRTFGATVAKEIAVAQIMNLVNHLDCLPKEGMFSDPAMLK